MAHADKRHSAARRAARVAAGLGFGCITDYVTGRRTAGRTWREMAAESGPPQSWLCRAAGGPASGAG